VVNNVMIIRSYIMSISKYVLLAQRRQNQMFEIFVAGCLGAGTGVVISLIL
jgi:hypothetical protein